MLDMRRPGIDEGHVLAGLHHMGAGVAADRACANKGYFLAHKFLAFPVVEFIVADARRLQFSGTTAMASISNSAPSCASFPI